MATTAKPAKKTKKQDALDRARVGRIYGQVANGRQVPIMALTPIMAAGLLALDAGGDDAAIGVAVKAAVDKVAVA